MDYSDEYVDDAAMDAESGGIPKELRYHPIPLDDRILHAQSLPTPPKVTFIPSFLCFYLFFFTFSHTFLNNKIVKLTFFPYQASQLILFQSQIRRIFKQDLDYKTFKKSFLKENDSIIYYRHYR